MNKSQAARARKNFILFSMMLTFLVIHEVMQYGIKARNKFQGRKKYSIVPVTVIRPSKSRQLKAEEASNHSCMVLTMGEYPDLKVWNQRIFRI
jgi:hypothetical protein